ncbi:MmgE/PrpD family protein [Agrobacterium vitis]|uniref:2-methylcitrate dehydratase n=2 Tax=Agrobacterium vitis TaxID=373 RepID=A0AAE4WET5_AGRVI|nr:MmgE/PrpD family protein [Agrobacterium vitis]MCF1499877.1 MmgE/PrpD family protein [Allorhizobium sp. Av2]MCM2442910.1 MmgE/PrpD family protein [Agrobacterium vitis]MUZ58849.1 2-methylcitrate dehydratase [Agrobacterium vitis]MVA66484.1 2-methylcitrate dehydratase [Agrobacterium vitis]MVA88521.1 2-methylcitrate dehydratase [Agrobacterium vitis]
MTTLIDDVSKRITSGAPFRQDPLVSQGLSIHVLDTIGAWIAGRATREGHRLSLLRDAKAQSLAPLTRSTLDTIALRVATARLSEVDDVHMPSCTTPGAIVVMTALSLMADLADRADAILFIDALHAGYEIMTRLGEAVSGPDILHKGIWPTYLLAPVTTAAVTAKLLGLDWERTAHALAIALSTSSGRPGGSVSGGVVGGAGTSARWLLAGLAAKTGCIAALSASKGFNGDRNFMDGEWPARSHGVTLQKPILLNVFEGQAAVLGTSIKPYCAAKHAIAAIDGFQMLLKQGIPLDAVTKVVVKAPPVHAGMIGHHDVSLSRLSRITSCSYNLALAAFWPDKLLDIERTDAVTDPAVVEFAKKVEVLADPELARQCPQNYPATIDLFNNERIIASIAISDALGDPAKPFDLDLARGKFRRLARGIISESLAVRIEQCCLDLNNPTAGPELAAIMTEIDNSLTPKTVADHDREDMKNAGIISATELERKDYGRVS